MISRLAVLISVLLTGAARLRASDEVFWVDPAGHTQRALGHIVRESPAGVRLQVIEAGPPTERFVRATAIVDVHYELPAEARLQLQRAINRENETQSASSPAARKVAGTAAIAEYRSLAASVSLGSASRHFRYKVVQLTADQAGEDPAALAGAAEAASQFVKAYPQSWQAGPCGMLLARLQILRGDVRAACAAYDQVAGTTGVSPETAAAARVAAMTVLVKFERYAEAERRADPLAQEGSPDAKLVKKLCRLGQHDATALGDFDSAAVGIRDPNLKALAFNTRGDFLRQAGRNAEARWDYLKVAVLWHEDAQEYARALWGLYQAFKALGNTAEAARYRTQLESDPRFARTAYPARLAAER